MSIPYDFTSEQWGMLRPKADGVLLPYQVDKVIIHWGGSGYASTTTAESIKRLQSWDAYHLYTKGWSNGIAYNAAIDNPGSIFRLRGLNRAGANRGDYEPDGKPENEEGFAVVWIGGAKSQPSEAAFDAMTAIINSLGNPPVIGHQEIYYHGTGGSRTACPGGDWMQYIADEEWLNAPPPPPPPDADWPQPEAWAAPSWEKAKALGAINEFTVPGDGMEKDEFFVFLDRLGILDMMAELN
ncbi:hypothetical protein LCGC14_1564280 [marine sediment metagenome]|uniref:Uncharacterized protein n=1 Tax=marine sediment metagenome TaxID=412755 RepID=A0A0F9ILJ3_9ZZZZ